MRSPNTVESLPEVVEAFRVTGEDCFILRCLIAEPEDLERVVDSLAAYGSVATSLVLSHPVSKGIPVPQGRDGLS
jgi:Lrp/AsnC family leucine-responsive transcriptional regulator